MIQPYRSWEKTGLLNTSVSALRSETAGWTEEKKPGNKPATCEPVSGAQSGSNFLNWVKIGDIIISQTYTWAPTHSWGSESSKALS